MKNNRFWEFYLVRYLAGTIFGVMILFYLFYNYECNISRSFFYTYSPEKYDCNCPRNEESGKKLLPNLQEQLFDLLLSSATTITSNGALSGTKVEDPASKVSFQLNPSSEKGQQITISKNDLPILSAIIIAVAGFFYMYLSSMFILIFHGVRVVGFSAFIRAERWSESKLANIRSGHSNNIWSVIQKALLRLIGIPHSIHLFYVKLSEFRAIGKSPEGKPKNKEAEAVNEYVESYRHLREHGNAFGIILCEIIFALFLIMTDFKIGWLSLWLIFGYTAWLLGSYLEVKRVDGH